MKEPTDVGQPSAYEIPVGATPGHEEKSRVANYYLDKYGQKAPEQEKGKDKDMDIERDDR